MSGHSKWSKVKHQKASTDAVKGKIFTKLANAIIIAVKQGGGNSDPESNFKLRLAIEKAKSMNVPKDNIERAIEKGKGGLLGEDISEVTYEAYGPSGIGIIIEAATNNKQRTVAELKNILDRGGGSLAASGAVSYMFDYVGVIEVEKQGKSFDEIMNLALESGAEDIAESGLNVEIFTKPHDLHKVKESLAKILNVFSYELFFRPKSSIPVRDKNSAEKILKLLTALEDIDDISKIHANYDIPDEYLT